MVYCARWLVIMTQKWDLRAWEKALPRCNSPLFIRGKKYIQVFIPCHSAVNSNGAQMLMPVNVRNLMHTWQEWRKGNRFIHGQYHVVHAMIIRLKRVLCSIQLQQQMWTHVVLKSLWNIHLVSKNTKYSDFFYRFTFTSGHVSGKSAKAASFRELSTVSHVDFITVEKMIKGQISVFESTWLRGEHGILSLLLRCARNGLLRIIP